MANLFKFVFLSAIFCVVIGKHEIYDGHSLYEVSVKNVEEAKFVNDLENQMPIDIFMYTHPERAGNILVPKLLKKEFESILSYRNIDFKLQVQNIKEQLELEDQLLAAAAKRSRSNTTSRAIPGLNFDEIHRFDVVDDYLVRLAAAYPDTVSVASAGRSFEGRDIKYLRISTTNFQDLTKPVVFLMSLLHAREWVTLPVTLFAIERLVIDVQERDLLEDIDWIILPIANPDGYEFSHTNSRFWRKNLATGYLPDNSCIGVDLNRNFDSTFWGSASSNNPCVDTFHGLEPFSEPETRNIRDLLAAYRTRIAYFADIHSFGSMILFGFGDGNFPSNALNLNLNAVNQAQAIDRVKWDSKRNYIVGNTFHVLYAASGISSDYATLIGIPYSYTYELPGWRDTSGTVLGFLVEPEFIRQAGFETWEGIKTGARFASRFWVRSNKLR